MSDRAAFEAWHGAYAGVMGKTKDGKYANSIIESQWLAWQEAARQEREGAVAMLEKVAEETQDQSPLGKAFWCRAAAAAVRSRSPATQGQTDEQ